MSTSYFESLGRQQLAPFTDEKLDYAVTEPDGVKSINESIDRNIRVRSKDFAQHIQAYNAAYRSSNISSKLKSIADLTQKGKSSCKRNTIL